MIWSSLVKSACVAIALSGFSRAAGRRHRNAGVQPGGAVERGHDLESV